MQRLDFYTLSLSHNSLSPGRYGICNKNKGQANKNRENKGIVIEHKTSHVFLPRKETITKLPHLSLTPPPTYPLPHQSFLNIYLQHFSKAFLLPIPLFVLDLSCSRKGIRRRSLEYSGLRRVKLIFWAHEEDGLQGRGQWVTYPFLGSLSHAHHRTGKWLKGS